MQPPCTEASENQTNRVVERDQIAGSLDFLGKGSVPASPRYTQQNNLSPYFFR